MSGKRVDSGADDFDPIAEAMAGLHRSGWSVGDAASHDGAGGEMLRIVLRSRTTARAATAPQGRSRNLSIR